MVSLSSIRSKATFSGSIPAKARWFSNSAIVSAPAMIRLPSAVNATHCPEYCRNSVSGIFARFSSNTLIIMLLFARTQEGHQVRQLLRAELLVEPGRHQRHLPRLHLL